jgi:lipopolysaccharide/colanic/teichoic acid biosynthesis glycosyltransferase
MSAEHGTDAQAIPQIDWPTWTWPRIEFQEPGPDGLLFGFLFRLIAAILAVIFSSSLMLVVGALNGWVLTTRWLGFHFVIIAVFVLLAEHFRSRVYERLFADEDTPLTVDDIRPLPEEATAPLALRARGGMAARTFDIVAAAALLVLLAPSIVLIAVLVRLDSPGPVFYRGRRIGKRGKQFDLLKFRTMSGYPVLTDIESYQRFDAVHFKLASDPRVTRAGRFLRRTSLDELPTLLNVIKGDMSFVGPRPRMAHEYATLRKEVAERVESVRPGLVSLGTPVYWRLDAGADWESLLLAEIQFHERASTWQKVKLFARVALDVLRGAGAV